MLNAILSGISRAFPFLSREEVNTHLQPHVNSLFRLVHTSCNFNQAVQTLMVLFHFMKHQDDLKDRFYQVSRYLCLFFHTLVMWLDYENRKLSPLGRFGLVDGQKREVSHCEEERKDKRSQVFSWLIYWRKRERERRKQAEWWLVPGLHSISWRRGVRTKRWNPFFYCFRLSCANKLTQGGLASLPCCHQQFHPEWILCCVIFCHHLLNTTSPYRLAF